MEHFIPADIIPAYKKLSTPIQVFTYCIRSIAWPRVMFAETIHARGINYHHALIKVVLEHPVRGDSSLQYFPVVIIESEIFQQNLIIQGTLVIITYQVCRRPNIGSQADFAIMSNEKNVRHSLIGFYDFYLPFLGGVGSPVDILKCHRVSDTGTDSKWSYTGAVDLVSKVEIIIQTIVVHCFIRLICAANRPLQYHRRDLRSSCSKGRNYYLVFTCGISRFSGSNRKYGVSLCRLSKNKLPVAFTGSVNQVLHIPGVRAEKPGPWIDNIPVQ